MSRLSTVPAAWKEIVEIAGGSNKLAEQLDMTQSGLFKAMRGTTSFSPQKQEEIQILCDLYEIDNPLDKAQPPSKNLTNLKMLGEALEQGFPPGQAFVARLKKQYPLEQLTLLAESDHTPPTIMRAVQFLLET